GRGAPPLPGPHAPHRAGPARVPARQPLPVAAVGHAQGLLSPLKSGPFPPRVHVPQGGKPGTAKVHLPAIGAEGETQAPPVERAELLPRLHVPHLHHVAPAAPVEPIPEPPIAPPALALRAPGHTPLLR